MKLMRLIDIWHLWIIPPRARPGIGAPRRWDGAGPGQARPRRAGTGLGEGGFLKDQLVEPLRLADPGQLYRYSASGFQVERTG